MLQSGRSEIIKLKVPRTFRNIIHARFLLKFLLLKNIVISSHGQLGKTKENFKVGEITDF